MSERLSVENEKDEVAHTGVIPMIDTTEFPTSAQLGAAIRSAYQGRFTQSQLAARLGVAQNTISRWSTGDVKPSLQDVARIEDACDVPRGFVLRSAGYVIDLRSTEEMINADINLTKEQRELLLVAYRVATRQNVH
jgi:transcriptional regulator with XRE-family HTH domain